MYRLASAAPDNDGDGISDATDTDDDNDGIPDASDSSPFDANSTETESRKKLSGGSSGLCFSHCRLCP